MMATQIQTDPSDQLTGTLRAIRGSLEQAVEEPISTYRSTTRLVGGLRTETEVGSNVVTTDQAAPLGEDSGPSPVELVLAALGACQEVVYGVHARLLGIPLESVTVAVEAEIDLRGFFGAAEVPVGFRRVTYTADIRSSASPEQIARLVEVADAHCPVSAILREPVPVESGYVLNGLTPGAV
jgi:putative redox protein